MLKNCSCLLIAWTCFKYKKSTMQKLMEDLSILHNCKDRTPHYSQVPLKVGRQGNWVWLGLDKNIIVRCHMPKKRESLLQVLCRKMLEKRHHWTCCWLIPFGLFRVPQGSWLVISWNWTVCWQEDESPPLYCQPGKCLHLKNLVRITEKQSVNRKFSNKNHW